MKKVYNLFVVIVVLSMLSCRPVVYNIDYSIILESYNLDIAEPSGLAYSPNRESLYIVSDQGMAYQVSLTGKTLKQLPFTGDDFEGITVDPSTSDIYICEEGIGNFVKLNSNGIEQSTYNVLDNPGNTGLEGLTYNPNTEEFYMLKEKSEGLLIKYSVNNNTETQVQLNFAYDYSGIYYNSVSNKLWIVSDESKTLTQCTMNGTKIISYQLPIGGVEGIVVNDDETVAYVVSDPNNKLYKLDLTIE
ncbi:MAG: SdiA-regulated domain-containing protein [Bacteroidota bacterium]